jgi:hypothetical protein
MSEGEIILYTSEDGVSHIQLRVGDGTVWLTQLEIAELFQTTKQNVSLHARNVLHEGELQEQATVMETLTVHNTLRWQAILDNSHLIFKTQEAFA